MRAQPILSAVLPCFATIAAAEPTKEITERDKGTIIAFVGGEKDAVTVQEKPEQIIKDR